MAVALLPARKLDFSDAHKSNITRIASPVCTSAKVEPCPLQWGGKSKWTGTLAPQGGLSVVSPEGLRNALPSPEWAVTEASTEYRLENGKYAVAYIRAAGSIVITSVP